MDLLSFHGKQEIKDFYIARVRAHQEADEIRKGVYWQEGKGCSVGCTIHSGNHRAYETELGLPEWLARLEDCLFEGMSNADAKGFPLALLQAIPVGVNLNRVQGHFHVFLLKENLERVAALDITPELKTIASEAIRQVLQFHEQALASDWSYAAAEQAMATARLASAVEASLRSVDDAARSAAWYAVRSAKSAAWFSIRSPKAAAWAAGDAAEAAAWAARAAADQETEWFSVAAYKRYASHLLALLRAA